MGIFDFFKINKAEPENRKAEVRNLENPDFGLPTKNWTKR